MRERLLTVLALSAAAVLAVCCCAAMVRGVGRGRAVALEGVSFTDLSALRRWSGREGAGRTTSLASTAGDPIPAGHVIHVDVPGSALQSLRVGATIKGKVNKQMLRQDGTEAINAVDFVGKVRSLQMITVQGKVQSNVLGEPDEGVVSVKLMSDHYVAPGTPVTGMVAGKIFKGVVTKAPSIQDRMDEAEKRMRELAPPVCDEICKLEREIELTQKRIDDFKASRKLRKISEALEKRVDKLAHPPPPPEKVAILGNWAGFKFNLPAGPSVFAPRISQMSQRLGEIPKDFTSVMAPLYKKTQKLEKTVDHLEGLKNYNERMKLLKEELEATEQCIADAGGDKAAAAPCIRGLMASNKFRTYHNREAQDEADKPRGPGAPPLGSEDEEWEEEGSEPGEDASGEGGGSAGEGEGQSVDSGEGGEEGAEKDAEREGQDDGDEEEAEQRRAEGEPAAGEAEEKVPRVLGQTLRAPTQELRAVAHGGLAGVKARTARTQSRWAPGQKQTWERFLRKTDKMDGLANDEDNVIAQWA